MTGYRKIKSLQPNDPSSDFSLSSAQTKHIHKSNQQSQESKTDEPHVETETGDTYTEKKISGSGATKLRRYASISSSSSSSVKRAFSIPRSSSFSERYRRIHGQYEDLSSLPDDEEFDQSYSKEKKSSSKRILKSCMRLFGL
ncbi:hypothetical protein CASFOL_035723 [Castilleja foliolosa]|uniref:Uncharacterized protein n=1 Tax=Castilleja foliolosa TaxID=1961234 RepID=A0ABD3BTG3_9LAMI